MSRAPNPKEKWFLHLFHEFSAMICTHLSHVLYQFGKYDFRSSELWFNNYFTENHKIINGNATNFLINEYLNNKTVVLLCHVLYPFVACFVPLWEIWLQFYLFVVFATYITSTTLLKLKSHNNNKWQCEGEKCDICGIECSD